MAWKRRRVCRCGKIIAATDLCACQIKRKAETDRLRPNANDRGYDSKWRRESKAFLALPQNRFCACGCGRIADCVDHIVPHRGDMKLFWSRSNWQPLASSPCHANRKQSLERSK
ncbi:HNH endonuclease [Bradyrhizobium barranii subsp. barranii]|uniref:HNH endonuclease n=1 Tax=Bradyrhizobium barranii subsp. barranii TaxID=2823807 RepID=A0A939MAG0_9BRAD|nr:HNH endonuclease [Bradyrhizobium barranii]UEM16587.1 HNH endonuclease [Bradyrhizobium barranii subsp. barranii]